MISGCKTDKGKIRHNNEDSYFVDDIAGVYIVADGIGGSEGGEVASNLAVNILGDLLSKKTNLKNEDIQQGNRYDFEKITKIIKNSIITTNDTILKKGMELNLVNMGTTLVLVKCFDDSFFLGNIGDSRAYLWKKTESNIQQLTEDDSLINKMNKEGQIISDQMKTQLKHVITEYIGKTNFDVPIVRKHTWVSDDLILLCTDGLTNMVSDAEIEKVIVDNLANIVPQKLCNLLIDKANKNGGFDNITVLIIQNKS